MAPFPPIRMIAAPTETVSPSCAITSRTTPSYELGTSVSTLSVDTSNSGSSNSTSSPTFLKKAADHTLGHRLTQLRQGHNPCLIGHFNRLQSCISRATIGRRM